MADSPEVAALFAAALDLPPQERSALLDGHPSADVVHRVRALLEAHLRCGAFLEAQLQVDGAAVEATAPGAVEPMTGDAVGRWRLERLLGRGGMGEVFLAVRDDAGFVQRGALKLLRRGVAGDRLVRRLRDERRLLARLEHPGIARLIDGGETGDGRPYLVMEQVDGQPIDAWCDGRSSTLETRLALAVAVCEAVAAAHRALVVHGDLKPSNILVDAQGAPRLVDFGIARLLDDDTQTRFEAFTPRYASPEQIAGVPITVATDVHALGVVLHELLVGVHPHVDVLEQGTAALANAIATREPRVPSTLLPAGLEGDAIAARRGTRREALRRAVSGDLDAVLLMALRNDPARRYRSVDALADDLRRHLAGRPIAARPDSAGYRLACFVRRHRVAVAAGALSLVAVCVALVATTISLVATREARDEARRQLAATRGVMGFVTDDLLAGLDPMGAGSDLSMREALDAAALAVGPRLAATPEAAAPIHGLLGRAYARLDERDRARENLLQAIGAAPAGSEDPAVLAARIQLAFLDGAEGRRDEAISALRVVASEAGRARGASDPAVVEALEQAADLLVDAGRHDEAFEALDEAEAAIASRPDVSEAELLPLRGTRVRALHYAGRHAEAETLGRQVLERSIELRGAAHPETVGLANNLGQLLADQDRHEEAAQLFQDAHERLVEALGPEHRWTLVVRSNLALLAFRRNDFATAEAISREVAAVRERRLGPEHPDTLLSRQAMAMAILNQERRSEAIPMLESLREARRRVLGERHPQTLNTDYNLAMACFMDGRSAEAVALLRGVLQAQDESLGPDHPNAVLTLGNLVEILLRSERFREALGPAEDFAARTARIYPEGHNWRSLAEGRLSRAREGAAKEE